MSTLNGRWLIKSADNLEAYLNAAHSPDEFKTRILTLFKELGSTSNLFVQEITINKSARNVQLKVFIKGELKQDIGPIALGKEIEHTGIDGRQAKIKITEESDTKIVMHKKGSNFESLITAQLLSSDEMTMTMTCGGVTSVEKYKRI